MENHHDYGYREENPVAGLVLSSETLSILGDMVRTTAPGPGGLFGLAGLPSYENCMEGKL